MMNPAEQSGAPLPVASTLKLLQWQPDNQLLGLLTALISGCQGNFDGVRVAEVASYCNGHVLRHRHLLMQRGQYWYYGYRIIVAGDSLKRATESERLLHRFVAWLNHAVRRLDTN